jgi:hypothetical protein
VSASSPATVQTGQDSHLIFSPFNPTSSSHSLSSFAANLSLYPPLLLLLVLPISTIRIRRPVPRSLRALCRTTKRDVLCPASCHHAPSSLSPAAFSHAPLPAPSPWYTPSRLQPVVRSLGVLTLGSPFCRLLRSPPSPPRRSSSPRPPERPSETSRATSSRFRPSSSVPSPSRLPLSEVVSPPTRSRRSTWVTYVASLLLRLPSLSLLSYGTPRRHLLAELGTVIETRARCVSTGWKACRSSAHHPCLHHVPRLPSHCPFQTPTRPECN